MTATSTRNETTHDAGRCCLCGLLLDFCPCDRHDLFSLADAPLQIEVTIFGRAAAPTVKRYTVTDDGNLLPVEEEDDEAAGYPSEAEWNAMQEEADDLRRREAEPFTDPEPDHYPTLAVVRPRG